MLCLSLRFRRRICRFLSIIYRRRSTIYASAFDKAKLRGGNRAPAFLIYDPAVGGLRAALFILDG